MLDIKNLKVSIENKEILKGIDLGVDAGQLHVLMGPNGSGKSTLAQVIAGHPSYKIIDGRLWMSGKEISKLTPDKRAKLGIFLAFQHPVEIPGVSVFAVLRKAKNASSKYKVSSIKQGKRRKPNTKYKIQDTESIANFRNQLLNHLDSLKLSRDFLSRPLNDGFSGGEKKRSEILQMMALSPKLVILDEIDSGLDVDALKTVATSIYHYNEVNPKASVLLITHYARILKYLKPDFVHIMMDGKIVKSGKLELAKLVEEKGYQKMEKEVQYA